MLLHDQFYLPYLIGVSHIQVVEQLHDVVVAEPQPGRDHLLLHNLPHVLVPVPQPPLQHALPLEDGQALDVHLLRQKLVRGPSHVLVNVHGPLQDMLQRQLGRSDAADDGAAHDVVGVVREVEQIRADDRTLLVLGVLEPLERGDGLGADLRHLVLEPLQHPVVDLVVQIIVNTRLLAHVLQDLVQKLTHPEPGICALHLVMVEQPGEDPVQKQRELLFFVFFLSGGSVVSFIVCFLFVQEAAGKLSNELCKDKRVN